MIDASVIQLLIAVVTSWLDRCDREAIGDLVAENRLLRRQLHGQRLRSRTMTEAGWPHGHTAWAVRRCGRSPRS